MIYEFGVDLISKSNIFNSICIKIQCSKVTSINLKRTYNSAEMYLILSRTTIQARTVQGDLPLSDFAITCQKY